MTDLTGLKACRDFEQATVGQVARGGLAAAAAAVDTLIQQSDDARLIESSTAPLETTIDSWDEIVADFLDAHDQFARRRLSCDVAALELVNRDSFPELRVTRHFYSNSSARPVSFETRWNLEAWARRGEEPVVAVRGLEPLVAVQRSAYTIGADREREQTRHQRAQILGGLLIVIRYMRAIERMLRESGLPAAVPVLVSVDQVSRPQEANVRPTYEPPDAFHRQHRNQ